MVLAIDGMVRRTLSIGGVCRSWQLSGSRGSDPGFCDTRQTGEPAQLLRGVCRAASSGGATRSDRASCSMIQALCWSQCMRAGRVRFWVMLCPASRTVCAEWTPTMTPIESMRGWGCPARRRIACQIRSSIPARPRSISGCSLSPRSSVRRRTAGRWRRYLANTITGGSCGRCGPTDRLQERIIRRTACWCPVSVSPGGCAAVGVCAGMVAHAHSCSWRHPVQRAPSRARCGRGRARCHGAPPRLALGRRAGRRAVDHG